MGSSKSATVGYRYYLGVHFGLCHGPVDELQKIVIGEREAWAGAQSTSGAITINQPELFGGDQREGGVVGTLDVLIGESTQVENTYLQAKIGALIPAFRGILSAVWRGGQVTSNNPYIKPWAFRVKRILQGWTGGTAWYPEKAQIPGDVISIGSDYPANMNQPATEYAWMGSLDGPMPAMVGTLHELGQALVDERNRLYIETYGGGAQHVTMTDVVWSSSINRITASGYDTAFPPPLSSIVGLAWMEGAVPECPLGGEPSWNSGEGEYFCAGGNVYSYDSMNPAHIIYQCLTDTNWGMGYPTSAIDNTTFTAVADALYAENFGLSMVWNQQETIENFVGVIMDHIGGILYVDPATGKFALKLLRADYNRESLPQYGATNLISAERYQRQAWGETINEISVVYTDYNIGNEVSVTVQDIANINMQGGIVSQIRSYTGITNPSLAQRVALRDLQSLATPLARIELRATRAAWSVFPGDVFRLSWPEYGIDDVVYRALEVNRGTLQNGEILIKAVEDVFGLPDNTYLVEQTAEWVNPSNPPAAAPYRKMIEAPYWDLARNLSVADLYYVDTLSGYLETAAVRPSGDATNYSIYARVGSADYAEGGNGDFCPSATVVEALTKTTTAVTLANAVDLDIFEVGGYAVIDSEYVLVSALDATALTATISRGVLDTVPVAHSSGARIWFADSFTGFTTTEYVDGEVVDIKLLPVTGRGELDISLAPVDSLTMDQRQYRPYPPGNVRFDTLEWPAAIDGAADIVMTWAHRDRLAQTAYIVEQDEASIGPEASVTYSVEVADEALTVLHSATGITAATATVPASSLTSGMLRFRLWSVRGGVTNWQTHEHFAILGDVRVTEDGEARITEDGEYRVID